MLDPWVWGGGSGLRRAGGKAKAWPGWAFKAVLRISDSTLSKMERHCGVLARGGT